MLTLFTIEKRFDPGFTMVMTVDPREKVAEYYIRNHDGTITERRELPQHREWALFAKYELELVKEAEAQMEVMAHHEQIARGWRDPEVAAKVAKKIGTG